MSITLKIVLKKNPHGGSTQMGDQIWHELFHPVAIRLISKYNAVLRISGPSGGADEMVRIGQEKGKRILFSLA